jgi:hypothetical protein
MAPGTEPAPTLAPLPLPPVTAEPAQASGKPPPPAASAEREEVRLARVEAELDVLVGEPVRGIGTVGAGEAAALPRRQDGRVARPSPSPEDEAGAPDVHAEEADVTIVRSAVPATASQENASAPGARHVPLSVRLKQSHRRDEPNGDEMPAFRSGVEEAVVEIYRPASKAGAHSPGDPAAARATPADTTGGPSPRGAKAG